MDIEIELIHIVIATGALAACGVALLVFGGWLSRVLGWIALGFHVILLALAAVLIRILADTGATAKVWPRGWVLPRGSKGALEVGVILDPSAVLVALAAFLLGTVYLATSTSRKADRAEFRWAAACLSTAGVAVSWLAATPWLGAMGLALAILAGGLSHLVALDQPSEAGVASRYLIQGWGGLMLLVLGICATVGAGVDFGRPDAAVDGRLGLALAFGGVLLQFHGFPLMRWTLSPSGLDLGGRLLLCQIGPAAAALALLLRLVPHYDAAGMSGVIAWTALVFAVLTLLASVLARGWGGRLALWFSAAAALAVTLTFLCGTGAGVAWLVCASLAALGLALASSVLRPSGPSRSGGRVAWVKAVVVLSVCAGTGMAGFTTSGTAIGLFRSVALRDPVVYGACVLTWLLFVFSAWALAWVAIRSRRSTDASWFQALFPGVLLIPTAAIFLTGRFLGGVIPELDDFVWPSYLDLLSPGRASGGGMVEPGLDHWFHWAIFLTAPWLALWFVRRHSAKPSGKFSAWVLSSYGMESVVRASGASLIGVGRVATGLIDEKIWRAWVPSAFVRGVRWVGIAFGSADAWIGAAVTGFSRKAAELPGKYAQLLHSGDSQWYLMFLLLCILAVVARFAVRFGWGA